MQLLLTIPQAGYDAQATVASGVQTGLTISSQAQSFLFAGAAALKGATITAATLRVRLALGGNLFDWGTTLACEDADNAAPFANGEPFANWTGRPRTPPVEWDLLGSNPITQGQRLDSASIAAAVQQVVDRAGFVDTLQVFWDFDPSAPPRVWHYEQHPTAAAELLIDYLPPASDSVLVEAADAIVATLAAGAFSQPFTPVRSYAQWQRPFEVADAVGLQVDVIAFPQMDDDLNDRGSVKYEPAIDIVIRKKFAGSDLEEVPGENEARVKSALVDGLVGLLEEINESLVARRMGTNEVVAWKDSRILATYVPAHLRDKHQYTGVIRVPTEVVKALPQ